MNPDDAVDLGREALRTTMMVGGPILAVGLLIGLAVGILQAMTQVQDQTVSFVPKILLMILAIAAGLPWLSEQMIDFTRQSLESPTIMRGSRSFAPPRDWVEPDEATPHGFPIEDDEVALGRPTNSMPMMQQENTIPTLTNRFQSSMPMMGSRKPDESATSRIADSQDKPRNK